MSVAVWLMAWAPLIAAPDDTAPRTAILDTTSVWRYHATLRDPVYGTRDSHKTIEDKKHGHRFHTEAPAADWMGLDFDDANWGRQAGPFMGGYGDGQQENLGSLSLRGGFTVLDSGTESDLFFSAVFRGGLAVYLNGREIARSALPEGDLSADTLADDYPTEAYFRPDGKIIGENGKDHRTFKDRCDLRLRRMDKVRIPGKHLRPGVNVLAIRIQRTARHEDMLKTWKGRWNTAGLHSVRLEADGAAAGLIPNVGRPAGMRVWNANPVTPVNVQDAADPTLPLRPVRIVGTRNGTFSGQIVVGGDAPVKNLQARMGEFSRTDGTGTLPASAARVRYPKLKNLGSHTFFDILSDSPPPSDEETGSVQPVWITVAIPADAEAGDYEGQLALAADGLDPTTVPVRLRVGDWVLPKPQEYGTFVDFVQSPESVALHYGLPLWSEDHFEKIGWTFAELARVGNKVAYIHLLCKSNHGNTETMVRWIRDGEGFRYDFAPAEKYLDLYLEKIGKPQFVVFYVWDRGYGGGYMGRAAREYKSVSVTLLDPETGQTSEMEGPAYNTPEAEAFWKPVAEGIRRMLAERGLEDRWVVGIASDTKPAKEPVEVWKAVAPEARWSHQGHGNDGRYHGVPVAYNTTVWQVRHASDPDMRRTYGWRRDPVVCQFHRDIWRGTPEAQLRESRLTGEKNIAGQMNGFGRMNADFWTVLEDGKGNRTRTISSRFPETSWSQCNIRMAAYFDPGSQSVRSTVRYEMLCEGIQECEARIFVEKALLDKAAKSKLGEETAHRLQTLIDTRTRMLIASGGEMGALWYGCHDWQTDSETLFSAAAEVAALLAR